MKRPQTHPRVLFFTVFLLNIALTLLLTLPTRAQSPTPIIVPVALAPLQRDTPIELTALTLDADISEIQGHTIISGNAMFKLHNTDRLNDLQVAVGLPAWAGDPYAFDPARFDPFVVSVDGSKVKTLNPSRGDLKIGNTVRTVDWYTFTLAIAGDEKKIVRYDFQQDLGDGALPRFTYGLFPATDWKGSIGSARLTLNFPGVTTLEQIVAYDPPNPEFDGQSVTWLFTGKEPAANPTLTFLRLSFWNDLVTKRRDAQQNLNNANARLALGNLLSQLAQMDSSRRDSFYGQAVAELETAVRLDPNHRAARQSLAALYEARAGAAAGPRNTAYVQLAVAQWEALQSDANARKQLAEDYFYLGLDAQTRKAYADAAAYYDKASALASNGAGPLFTPERLTAQRRTLNLVWASALLDQNDVSAAIPKARAALGDRFMAAFTPPLFYVTRVQVSTGAPSRTMLFTLAPLLLDETQNALSGVVSTLRAAGVDADMAGDSTNVLLTIAVPYQTSPQLRNQMSALAQTLPDRAEWSLVRAVLVPNDLDWNEADQLLMHATRYREGVDLSPACRAFTAQLDPLAQNLKPLESALTNDDEAQLKRALLKYAQRGWQSALANGRVTYHAGTEEARVESCAAQTLAWSSSSWQPERVALIVGVIELVGVTVLIVRWKRK